MNTEMTIAVVLGTVFFSGVGLPLLINWLFDKFGR